ncbi:sensor histidine kinase [Amycolatopsis suaedae]|uniref:Sensor histidine kinase n=1 Tax=Amycolatopsis suaedae TaxID=2510978 RepID=A0A4Q7J7K9_9PSEU|nr:histidine kinase [Amycolatopsis suaedae]RZQ62343.1 sensor histidine kinase [Amycolatopsis suaedae]
MTHWGATPELAGHARTRGRLRRLNLIMMVPPLVGVGALLVVIDARTWWGAVVLSMGALAGLVAMTRWASSDFRRVALPCLVVGAIVWPAGVLVLDAGSSFYGLNIVGPLIIPYLPRLRGVASVVLVAYVGGVGALRLLVSDEGVVSVLVRWVAIPSVVAVVTIGFMFASKVFYDLLAEVDAAREHEAELAVARERIRFASDLHDIQGHTLHVVKLKVALAQKLVRGDTERVEEELREVHTLVADTITQTKELVYAQRRLNLSAELENAKNLFEAAGIRVRVYREAEAGTGASELLGQVLRETTTNILRHAQAAQVRITLSESGITIMNDGARDGEPPELRGLATLSHRLADNGGELTVEQKDGRFTTAAVFPREGGGR